MDDFRIQRAIRIAVIVILVGAFIGGILLARKWVRIGGKPTVETERVTEIESETSSNISITEGQEIVRKEETYDPELRGYQVKELFDLENQSERLESYLSSRGYVGELSSYLSVIKGIKNVYQENLDRLEFKNPYDYEGGLYIEHPIDNLDLSVYDEKYNKFKILELDVVYCLDDMTVLLEYLPAHDSNFRFIVASLENIYVGESISRKYKIGDSFYLDVVKDNYNLEEISGETVMFVKG